MSHACFDGNGNIKGVASTFFFLGQRYKEFPYCRLFQEALEVVDKCLEVLSGLLAFNNQI